MKITDDEIKRAIEALNKQRIPCGVCGVEMSCRADAGEIGAWVSDTGFICRNCSDKVNH